MTKQEIFDKVASLVATHFSIEKEQVKNETDFVNDLHADSISIMEFIIDLEDNFEAEVTDDAAEGIATIGQLVAYIESVL
ncbi:MAG: acyl carrier protein [Streptococcaceae bacterium]|jgi:acyl carrier protein|nr:acyl carrier protein [Streptococcaceae bacterium]